MSPIDSPDWINNKQATINQMVSILYSTLNYEEINKDAQRITKIKSFINKCDWEGINFPSEKDDWKTFEKNNVTTALNVFYAKKEKIYPAYLSKNNSNHEKQVILLIIPNGEKCKAKSKGHLANSEGHVAKSKGR